MSRTINFCATETPPLPIHRFSVEEYRRLGEIGVLTPDDHVELLEGWIVEKMNQRPAHGFVVGLLTQWLLSGLSAGLIGRCQLPITTDRSEPEPDLAVVRGQHADFRTRHPNGNDCVLIIEVADTTVAKDRAKASIYASAGIEEYWIVNLAENQLERFTSPASSAYQQCVILAAHETVETRIVNQTLTLPLSELFV